MRRDSDAGFKWDDDLAVILPETLVERLQLKEGDEIDIVAADGSRGDGAATDMPKRPTREEGA